MDKTLFDLVPGSGSLVRVSEFEGTPVLKVDPEALALLAEKAFGEVEFKLRVAHNEQVASILHDPEASANDRFVARSLLRNAAVAAKGILPLCQDTGTATIYGWKGQQVWTGGGDGAALSEGVRRTWLSRNLRYSQNAPKSMYEEVNTGDNLPAQIEIEASDGMEYRFLCVAKGGGSANKTQLFQETKAILTPERLVPFLSEKIKALGTAACPPYHIAIVIGGTSAEMALKSAKLASCRYDVQGLRDAELEATLLEEARRSGIGAQFGGVALAHDIRVIRLPRHGASCPIALAVSCSADRNIECRIDSEGIWIERLDSNPERLLPERAAEVQDAVEVDLDRSMDEIRALLSKYPAGTRLSLTGTITVARDIAHARIFERVSRGEAMPRYMTDHPVMYAGPAKCPAGLPCGSIGPTTAGRMDTYVEFLQSRGASLIMIAKGQRSAAVADSCKRYGGSYLGTMGGTAALFADENVESIECIDYPELGMEAVWKLRVKNLPAFILL